MANPAIRCDLPDAAFRAPNTSYSQAMCASAESATRYELTLWYPARIQSALHSPEVAEYPDTNQITAQARTGSQTGERLWLIHDVG